jgi:UDP-arabinose 4-epimerase
MKAILVTGGAGYIGRATCRALKASGFDPVAFDNLSTGERSAVQWGPFVEGDLLNRAEIAAALLQYNPVGVIHLAGHSNVAESVFNPEKYDENVWMTCNVATSVGRLPVVFASSAAVYGEGGALAITEGRELAPLNPYGRTKVSGEHLLPDAMRLRYFNVAGGSGDRGGHLIPNFLAAAAGKRIFVLHGDGAAVRDYILVDDVARANVAALKALIRGQPGEALNVCSGVGSSVRQVIALCAGADIVPEISERRPGDADKLVGSNDRIRKVLRWEPSRDLAGIIRSARERLAWV